MKVYFQKRYSVTAAQLRLAGLESYASNLCWAWGPGHLMRSSDGGKTWKNLYVSSPLQLGTNPEGIVFHTGKLGILLAKRGLLELLYFRTEDGGDTWLQERRLDEGGYIWLRFFGLRQPAKIWCLIKRKNGKAFVDIFDSRSGGWHQISITIAGRPCQILFADDLTGWILERWDKGSWIPGSPAVSDTKTILHFSNDGGASWKTISRKERAALKIVLTSAGKLLMVGVDGIFISEDRGRTWYRVFHRPRVPLFDVHFQGRIGVALGTEGVIDSKNDILLLLSLDGGETWQEIDSPSPEAFLGVRMTTWSSGVLASDRHLYTFQISE